MGGLLEDIGLAKSGGKHIELSPIEPGLFTSQGCCRCKAQGMKLWYFTANAL